MKVKTSIGEKWGKRTEGPNAQLFVRLSAFSGLNSNYTLYRRFERIKRIIKSYTDPDFKKSVKSVN